MKRVAILLGLAVVALGLLGVTSAANQLKAGSLDPSFGERGSVVVPGMTYARAVALQPDGKIVVAGWGGVARFNPNGTYDRSFGHAGVVEANLGANAVAIQPDDKIVIAGGGGLAGFGITRYDANGSPDDTFGDFGTVFTPISQQAGAYGVAVRPDGKIVVAGTASDGTRDEFALAQLNSDGSLDQAFGNHGVVLTDAGTFKGFDASDAFGLVLQPDGKAVVVGATSCSNGRCGGAAVVARYMPDGSLDRSFGTNGEVEVDAARQDFRVAYAVALAPGGKIVVGGARDFSLARLNPDGSPDQDFGDNGVVTTRFAQQSYSALLGVALAPDGKIVAAGQAWIETPGQWQGIGLARYEPDGQLDPTFGKKGLVVTHIPHWRYAEADAVAVQPNGKVDIAGDVEGEDPFHGAALVARYLGEQPCVVPRVTGKRLRVAGRRIRHAGCTVGRVTTTFSRRVRKGHVISQRPRTGRRLHGGAKVNLVVSKGKRR